jgi:nitrogen fixation NifU-like protein
MSSELRELYQELILEHAKKPRNFGVLEHADHAAEGFNPLCGDRLKLYLQLNNNSIQDIKFEGSGCAIFKASSSMMTQAIKGKRKSEAEQLFGEFHSMLSGKNFDESKLGKLTVFSGVNEFPVRVKCATLPWHTLHAGLESNGKMVSTE